MAKNRAYEKLFESKVTLFSLEEGEMFRFDISEDCRCVYTVIEQLRATKELKYRHRICCLGCWPYYMGKKKRLYGYHGDGSDSFMCIADDHKVFLIPPEGLVARYISDTQDQEGMYDDEEDEL